MLKVYRMRNLVSIDDGEWRGIGESGHVMRDDEPTEEIIFENISFDECRDLVLSDRCPSGMWADETIFRHLPQIGLRLSNGSFEWHKKFNSISYKKTYSEATYLTLEDIMKRFSADKCIQYLKDRGMTACPMSTNGN